MATVAARIEREENLAHKTKNKRTDLTPTALLMEGVHVLYTGNRDLRVPPLTACSRAPALEHPINLLVDSISGVHAIISPHEDPVVFRMPCGE